MSCDVKDDAIACGGKEVQTSVIFLSWLFQDKGQQKARNCTRKINTITWGSTPKNVKTPPILTVQQKN